MFRFRLFATVLLLLFISLLVSIQIGAKVDWPNSFLSFSLVSLFLLLSQTFLHKGTKSSFCYDFLSISYSFFLALIVSLLLKSQNTDVRSWWPILILLGIVYANIIGLIYSLIALFLTRSHIWYTNVFAVVLFLGYLIQNWLPFYVEVKGLGLFNLFYLFISLILLMHLLVCVSYKVLAKS
ncbi:hypothetical protein B1207_15210 [Legionella quinlivanii]|uniref:Uncharacterized protein n=1 Tax=Legionella quinlivanii TaxID=45073 RepID=A0A364LFC4_9GAMM|nr:hypothetical protein B1207_15210 [Legionella quinlivanii]